MRFASEEVRNHYHELPTQTQLDWLEAEDLLTQLGYMLLIERTEDGYLEVRIRINEQPKRPSGEDSDCVILD